MHADLQRLLTADLLSDIGSKPMDRLRGIRTELTQAEGDISFVRRITQGRLDIVGHEVERRAGAPTSTDQDPTSTLLFEMPGILTDADNPGATSRGSSQAVAIIEPGQVAMAMVQQLDGIASPSQLSGIQSVDEGQLSDLFGSLREFELELSGVRRTLHDHIDAIQDEIARRYRDGEATVDALLQ